MVFGSHAKSWAMYSSSPCPSLAASMAAYRRRSFSDSHPKNRCIFPSISAVYSSIPSSWLQGLCHRQDTTAQASREVILNRILSRHQRRTKRDLHDELLLETLGRVWQSLEQRQSSGKVCDGLTIGIAL